MTPPSAEEKSFADFLSYEAYEDSLMDGILTQDEMIQWITDLGWWSKEDEENIETYKDNLDNMKIDYCNNFYHQESKKYIKSTIEKVEEKLRDLVKRKNVFFDKTCDYVQQYCFTSYLLEKNAILRDGSLAIDSFDLSVLFNAYTSELISVQNSIRKTAKSNEWRSIWHTGKNHHVFSNPPSSLTDEQISLISWSQYYDNINQSMDRPSDEIIQDDLALDGWSLKQARKRKEEDKERNAQSIGSDKIQRAGEIILPARNKKEVEEILSLNNAEGKRRLKELSNDLKSGSKTESELTSVRKNIQMESNRMNMNRNRK